MTEQCVGIFSSIHFVLKAEKVLKKSGIGVETIPVPRKISSDCGIAISFSREDLEQVEELLRNKKCRVEGIYVHVKGGDYTLLE